MRIILIDNNSGYIFGDSADLDGRAFSHGTLSETDFALAFAEALDRSIGNDGRSYRIGNARDGGAGYHAYRADVDGTDIVPIVHDGQSRQAIDAVESKCQRIGFVETRRTDD